MKIQSKILLTLKRNYRNTSMSSQTSKVFSDFKKWPRNLSEIMSSEKSPKSQRSSPQQICQEECFATLEALSALQGTERCKKKQISTTEESKKTDDPGTRKSLQISSPWTNANHWYLMSKCTRMSSVMIVDIRSYSKSQLPQADFASTKEIFVKTDSKISSLERPGFRPEGQPMRKDEGERFAPQEETNLNNWRTKENIWSWYSKISPDFRQNRLKHIFTTNISLSPGMAAHKERRMRLLRTISLHKTDHTELELRTRDDFGSDIMFLSQINTQRASKGEMLSCQILSHKPSEPNQ